MSPSSPLAAWCNTRWLRPDELGGEGISCEVIDPRTLVPLDVTTLVSSAKKTGRVVIAHEAHKRSGPGAEIAAVIAEHALDYLDAPIIAWPPKTRRCPTRLRWSSLCCQARPIF